MKRLLAAVTRSTFETTITVVTISTCKTTITVSMSTYEMTVSVVIKCLCNKYRCCYYKRLWNDSVGTSTICEMTNILIKTCLTGIILKWNNQTSTIVTCYIVICVTSNCLIVIYIIAAPTPLLSDVATEHKINFEWC